MDRGVAYERNPYLTSLKTRVVEAGEDSRGFYLVLEDTIFFPEGGGQPGDRGFISGFPVLDVQKVAGKVRHYLERPVAKPEVELLLDWARRFDHMQQHTGQHLLSALAEDVFGWRTTAFHLGAELCDVELDVPALTAAQLAALEDKVAEAIRQAHPVRAFRVSPEELLGLPKVRTRGLPPGHQGSVRLVEIAGLDLNTCGGTHLQNTAEIEALVLLGTEPMRGGTRVYFAAGTRVRRRLHAHEERNSQLRRLLGAPDPQLPAVAAAKLGELESWKKKLRRAQHELAQLYAAQLLQSSQPLVEFHWEDADLSLLQLLAQSVGTRNPEKTLFFTGGTPPQAYFLLAAPNCSQNLAAWGQQVAQLLEGKGGGSGYLFQGKASSLARRGEAVAWVQSQLDLAQ